MLPQIWPHADDTLSYHSLWHAEDCNTMFSRLCPASRVVSDILRLHRHCHLQVYDGDEMLKNSRITTAYSRMRLNLLQGPLGRHCISARLRGKGDGTTACARVLLAAGSATQSLECLQGYFRSGSSCSRHKRFTSVMSCSCRLSCAPGLYDM